MLKIDRTTQDVMLIEDFFAIERKLANVGLVLVMATAMFACGFIAQQNNFIVAIFLLAVFGGAAYTLFRMVTFTTVRIDRKDGLITTQKIFLFIPIHTAHFEITKIQGIYVGLTKQKAHRYARLDEADVSLGFLFDDHAKEIIEKYGTFVESIELGSKIAKFLSLPLRNELPNT
jgi:hypothetical protein